METLKDYFKKSAMRGVFIIALSGGLFIALGAFLTLYPSSDITTANNNAEVLWLYTLGQLPIMLMLSGAMFVLIATLVCAFRHLPYRYRKMKRTYGRIEEVLDGNDFDEYQNAIYYVVKRDNKAVEMPLEDINAIISLSNKVYAKTNVGFHHWGILLLVLEKKAKEQGLI